MSARGSLNDCDTCNGSGWFWWNPGGWVACATCNDDGAKPKPEIPDMTIDQLN